MKDHGDIITIHGNIVARNDEYGIMKSTNDKCCEKDEM